MVETEYRLEVFNSVTIDSDGTGTITRVGPTRPNERWHITRFSTQCASGCTLQVFRGNQTESRYQIDYTDRGDGDTSETDLNLSVGETISFKYSNGTTGTIATVRLEGSYYVPGKRAY